MKRAEGGQPREKSDLRFFRRHRGDDIPNCWRRRSLGEGDGNRFQGHHQHHGPVRHWIVVRSF